MNEPEKAQNVNWAANDMTNCSIELTNILHSFSTRSSFPDKGLMAGVVARPQSIQPIDKNSQQTPSDWYLRAYSIRRPKLRNWSTSVDPLKLRRSSNTSHADVDINKSAISEPKNTNRCWFLSDCMAIWVCEPRMWSILPSMPGGLELDFVTWPPPLPTPPPLLAWLWWWWWCEWWWWG